MDAETSPLEEKRADAAAQLEVDEAILEYLIYKATKTLVRDFQKSRNSRNGAARKQKVVLQLDLVDCKLRCPFFIRCTLMALPAFLVMFRAMHPDHQGTPEVQLRLRLLRFTTLFTRRQSAEDLRSWTQNLQELRNSHQKKANAFKASLALPDLTEYLGPSKDLKCVKHEHVLGNGTPDRPKGRNASSLPVLSLLDTVPSFMALSAAKNAMQESKITDTWMRLAAGYMAQAVVEQYLDYGSQRDDVMKEAFAWGFDPDGAAEETNDDWMVNAMFLDEEAEFKDWGEIRDEHLRAVGDVRRTKLALC